MSKKTELELARRQRDPYKRVQSLSWIVRFSTDADVRPVVKEAFESVFENEDPYKTVACSAWLLRALGERGEISTIRKWLPSVLEFVPNIEPPVSRGDALFLLFQALLPIADIDKHEILGLIITTCREAQSYKGASILRDVVLMLGADNPQKARSIVRGMQECRAKRQAIKRLDAGEFLQPREFFWEK